MRTCYSVRMEQKRGGARLRTWLDDNDRTQAWLAKQIGDKQQNLSAWIRGRPVPLAIAVAIRKVTDIPVEDWLVAAESGPDVTAEAAKSA